MSATGDSNGLVIGGTPSTWARDRFGKDAARLTIAVPERLARAHLRARAGYKASGLTRPGAAYGHTLAEALREELALEAEALGGLVRSLRGRAYAVINDQVLFPYKYGGHPAPVESAHMKDPSKVRRRLFAVYGPEEPEGLFSVDEYSTEEYEDLHEAFEELGRADNLVSVLFTCDPENGVHAIHWGEARLELDGTFAWAHREELRVVEV
ncbi:hypothetical protein AB0D78_01595 [Streptomyces avermitilis]|uniref:hypothetical protein n=1 Tax=Streptomyces avermitilis TaxID=33903 RepID=UPI00340DA04A